MDSVFQGDPTTVPDCAVSHQATSLTKNSPLGEKEVKDEIKEEPYDDEYPSSSQSYIYDPEDVKIEDEYDYQQSMEGNSLDVSNQLFDSSQSKYSSEVKKEEPADESLNPSQPMVAHNTSVKRVVAPVIACSICGEIFKFRLHMAKHIQEKHSQPISQKREAPAPKIRVRDAKKVQSWRGHTKLDGCFYVETVTISGTRKERGERETTITYLDCGVCGERFANARDHRTHAIRKHPGNKDERMCKNDYCVRMRASHTKFPPGDALVNGKLRARLAPMFDPVNCPICAVRQESYFQLYSHFGERHIMEYLIRFKCKSCSKTYTSPRGLQKHITIESEKFGKCCAGASIPMPTRRKQRLTEIPDDNLYGISDSYWSQ